jgi:predicted transcriptional regulator
MTTKEAIVKAMQELPDDAGYEEAIERLYVLYKIERGLEQLDAGQSVSHEEAVRRLAKWFP